MSSALDWFIELGTQYTEFSSPPTDALELCKSLAIGVQSKNDRLEVNRVFKKFKPKLPAISNWLESTDLTNAIYSLKNQRAVEIRSETVVALKKIIAGVPASCAWGMGAQRGKNAGYSATLEAASLVRYLTKIQADDWLPENLYPEGESLSAEYLLLAYVAKERKDQSGLLFTQAKALEIASSLFKVNKDNIRKHDSLMPINNQSEAGMGLFGLARINALADADTYFDVDDMVEAAKLKDVTI